MKALLSFSLLLSGLFTLQAQPAVNQFEESELRMIRQGIVQHAREFLGTRRQNAGRTPETGFDCSGFTSYVLSNYNIPLSPASKQQALQGRMVPLPDAQPGDLLVFSFDGVVQHVALLVEQDEEYIRCIHSTTSKGVIEEDILRSSYWMTRLYCVRDVVSEAMGR
jgi:cell wall-associated NlpC family hydrolase